MKTRSSLTLTSWDDWDDIDSDNVEPDFDSLDDGIELVSLKDAYDAGFDEYVDPDSLDDEFEEAYDDEFSERPVRKATHTRQKRKPPHWYRACRPLYLHRVSILALISMRFTRFPF